MPRTLMPTAEAMAAELGHAIQWDVVGEKIANGHCSACKMMLAVARTADGLVEAHGDVLEVPCPRGNPDARRQRNPTAP